MEKLQIDGLNVFTSGVHHVEISARRRIKPNHRVPERASVDVSNGEVRSYVDSEVITIQSRDIDER